MEDRIERLLGELDEREDAEWELQKRLTWAELTTRRDEFLLSVGRSAGMLLNLLIKESKSRHVLELGTSYGYSTVWLAEAARATGGTVISLELHPYKIERARTTLAQVGLAPIVTFRCGDARETIEALSGPFDFVLIDLWKHLYVDCFNLLLPKLSSGAFIAADNMLGPASARPDAEAYRRCVRNSGRFDSILLPIGKGIELSRHVRREPLASGGSTSEHIQSAIGS